MDVSARITGISYKPCLCKELSEYPLNQLGTALKEEATFLTKIDKTNKIAISWWVSPKRTRSYPYARVYDSLGFQGKKVTIIPIIKDEGIEGDRDFLQWDTISLMSLLGVYVIIAYYNQAEKNHNYDNKITNQRFETSYLMKKIEELTKYQSDALHWNMEQIKFIENIGIKAIGFYEEISKKLNVKMHSIDKAYDRIKEIGMGSTHFIEISRSYAQKAQNRESKTEQPKEKLDGTKGTLTIENYLGGKYYFTADEIKINKNVIYLIEGKHSKSALIPSKEDIKDGLLKMILFVNLKEVKIEGKEYKNYSVLKLTSSIKIENSCFTKAQVELLKKLKDESNQNNFLVIINSKDLNEII